MYVYVYVRTVCRYIRAYVHTCVRVCPLVSVMYVGEGAEAAAEGVPGAGGQREGAPHWDLRGEGRRTGPGTGGEGP